MIIVQVGEPQNKNVGDVWFDPTTKVTSRACTLGSGLVNSTLILWTPITARMQMPPPTIGLNPGFIYIDSGTQVPHLWDGVSWISAVPANYLFPKQPPNVADTWTESMSQVVYIFDGSLWKQLIGGVGAPTPGAVNSIPYPVVNPNHAPGYVYQNGNWAPAPGVVGAAAAPGNLSFQVAQPSYPSLTIGPQSNPALRLSNNRTGDMFVEIDPITGKITYGPNYTPDIAADTFWKTMVSNYPDNMINTLKCELVETRKELQQYIDAGFKLHQKRKPFDPNDAWDAAMGIIK